MDHNNIQNRSKFKPKNTNNMTKVEKVTRFQQDASSRSDCPFYSFRSIGEAGNLSNHVRLLSCLLNHHLPPIGQPCYLSRNQSIYLSSIWLAVLTCGFLFVLQACYGDDGHHRQRTQLITIYFLAPTQSSLTLLLLRMMTSLLFGSQLHCESKNVHLPLVFVTSFSR